MSPRAVVNKVNISCLINNWESLQCGVSVLRIKALCVKEGAIIQMLGGAALGGSCVGEMSESAEAKSGFSVWLCGLVQAGLLNTDEENAL